MGHVCSSSSSETQGTCAVSRSSEPPEHRALRAHPCKSGCTGRACSSSSSEARGTCSSSSSPAGRAFVLWQHWQPSLGQAAPSHGRPCLRCCAARLAWPPASPPTCCGHGPPAALLPPHMRGAGPRASHLGRLSTCLPPAGWFGVYPSGGGRPHTPGLHPARQVRASPCRRPSPADARRGCTPPCPIDCTHPSISPLCGPDHSAAPAPLLPPQPAWKAWLLAPPAAAHWRQLARYCPLQRQHALAAGKQGGGQGRRRGGTAACAGGRRGDSGRPGRAPASLPERPA